MTGRANGVTIDRRGLLGLLGAGSAAALPGCTTTREPQPVRFAHGVASGDPAADGAVIWTRATTADSGDVPLRWQVAEVSGGPMVRNGTAIARASADHTVKVEIAGLQPGREYFYRFEGPGGTLSPEGRFRTLPLGPTDKVVLAATSCQLYPGGFYNAYAHLARADRIDAVLMLGDYIYEYGPEGYGADIGRRLGRLPVPARETVTLSDYRLRHAQVKSDPDMQAAHARAAFICVWDDHEVTNDSWIGGAENHQPESEGSWTRRKAAALQAYFEWMPIRDPRPGAAREAIYRAFEFGDLLSLAMLETRLLARDEQAAFKGEVPAAGEMADVLAVRAQTDRELIGTDQREWLRQVLATSVRQGKPWQVIGNQIVMAKVAGPNLEQGLGPDRYPGFLAQLPAAWRDRVLAAQASYKAGVPFNLDAWDGYPAARERLYDVFRRTGSRPIVLAGDSHAGWANNLHDDAGRLVALEAGCTAITSPSFGALLPGIGRFIEAANPGEVAYCNQDGKGYTLLTLTPAEARLDFITVSSVLERDFTANVDRSFVARHRDATSWRELS